MTFRQIAGKLMVWAGMAWIMGVQVWGGGVAADDGRRFVHGGDGRIELFNTKNGRSFSGTFRQSVGQYDRQALEGIRLVFESPLDDPLAVISLRLIEFIDHLQDHFDPNARIEIASGWRSPTYNANLRKKGRLAATASLHQYGMAADIEIQGVASERVWHYVRELGFGGAGYYHGRLVHVDVGPARFWDETSSGVGSGLSDDNKLIGLVTDFDLYRPGEEVVLRFIRMTAFPIGVTPEFVLERVDGSDGPRTVACDRPHFSIEIDGPRPQFSSIAEMMEIRWRLPEMLSAGRYVLRASFCRSSWEAMPTSVATPAFDILKF